ncbi:MAG TPA: hypothetical protein VFI08_03955 [Spirochaetia bacterium]|nr:hypothetical protein [Spirochaetia bacterium]
MGRTVVVVIAVAVLFYAVLPAVGAVFARRRWRRFRTTVTTVSHYPTAGPAVMGQQRAAPAGCYRFFGTLEAIQGNDRIWLTNGRFSVAADLRNVRVYLIPEIERAEGFSLSPRAMSGAALGSVPWNRIFSLPEGTPVFVGGALFTEDGRAVFRSSGRTRLLVVIHDCPRDKVVLHAISGGRQRNEYINPVTLPSVAVGSLSLVLLALGLLGLPERLVALLALTAGLAPLAPFLPPGVPLYFAYRAAWKKARMLRVQRDVVSLPLRWFPASPGSSRSRRATLLPDFEPYLMVRGTRDENDPAVILSEGARLELPPGITRLELDLPSGRMAPGTPREVVAFCGYREREDGVELLRTSDPMADHVVLPGSPQELARRAERAARKSALLSVALIGLDVLVNLPLVFLLLNLVVR